MNKTKYNLFEQIYYAVAKPMKYYRITKTSGGRITAFVFLFVLITSLFYIIPALYTFLGPNGVTEYLNEDLPAFDLTDGQLSVAERFEEDDGISYVLIDTDVNSFSSDDVDGTYYSTILISKTNMVTYSNARTQVIKFSEFGGIHLDNGIIKVLIPFFYLMIVLAIIFVYLFMIGEFFVTALLYSLVGLIVSAVTHANLKYSKIFKTAIYGKVTVSILSAIFILLPFNLPGIIVKGLSILITCTYVVYGTLSHSSYAAKEEAEVTTPPQIN